MELSHLKKLSIIILNVHGLRQSHKKQLLFTWLKNINMTLYVNETYCTRYILSDFDKSWGAKTWYSESISNHSRGVCIMSNTELQHEIITYYWDSERRKIFLKIKIANDIFNILNIYAPNSISEKKQFFNSLYQWIESYISENYYRVIADDSNYTLRPEDRSSGKADICSKSMLNSLNQFNVIGIWRYKNPNKAEYSLESNKKDISSSHIDYIFLTKNLSFRTENYCIRFSPISDHKSIIVNIKCLDDKRGPNYWKFNVSYLKDKKFCYNNEELFNTILALSKNNKLSKTIAWDMFKIKVKEFSIKYCQNKSKLTKNEICKIEQEIQALDMVISKHKSLVFQNKGEELKHGWCNLICKSAEGAQIRAPAKYAEQGEKSTNYFINLEKQRQIVIK